MKSPAAKTLNARSARHLADLFGTLSDASRVRMLAALMGGEQSVSALADLVGISESAVSHHLRGLRQMRLVRPRKVGRQVFYSLDDDHIRDLLQRGLDHVLHG
jgi:DNA-binding transcriptional ArsR family regulator